MVRQKENKKPKDSNPNQKKKDKKSSWLLDLFDFIINLFSIILIASITLISCTSQSSDEELKKEVENRLEELFDDPIALDNKTRNEKILETFQDSGAFNDNSQKNGIWTEYMIEKKFGDALITVVSNAGDSNQIQWTEIVKYIGEYEDGYKVGNWGKYVLTNVDKPFKWEMKK